MTMQGTANKTGLLLLCVVVTAAYTWGLAIRRHLKRPSVDDRRSDWRIMLAVVTMFKKQWSPITAPIYALLEGFALGGISAMFERPIPVSPTQAVMLTFGGAFRSASGV